MDRRELLLVGILVGVIALGLGLQQWGGPGRLEPLVIGVEGPEGSVRSATGGLLDKPSAFGMQASSHPHRMDLNRATEGQLQQASGIGPALAKNLIQYRSTHGPFRSMEQALDVPGIGPSRLASLAELFHVPDIPLPFPAEAAREPQDVHSVPPEHDSPTLPSNGRLNLNRATAVHLQQLPGIGPVLSSEIVRYRERVGGFQTVEQLIEVPGIGPKRLEQVRSSVYVENPLRQDSAALPTGPGRQDSAVGGPGSKRISLNRAGPEQLETLPGIGPVLAGRIVHYRKEKGRFETLEQIQEVPGIGEKTFARLLPHIEL